MRPDPGGAIGELRAQTRAVLRNHLPPGTPVALLDFPNHQNAGDSLIWLGERGYVRDLGLDARYLASAATYDGRALRTHLPAGGSILLHGGGNFGDLSPDLQAFRERIVRDHTDHQIVQLPQSIHFRDPRRLHSAIEAFAAHPDVVLLVRDQPGTRQASIDFASATVEFCPDGAFGADMPTRRVTPSVDVGLLLRTDQERASDHELRFTRGTTSAQHDWGLTGTDLLAWKVMRVPSFLPGPNRLHALSFDGLAKLNVRRAVEFLSSARVVVTDRLHAAVMCALMRRPVICLDNSYGKVSRIVTDYLGAVPGVHLVGSDDEAAALATDLLASEPDGA